MIIKKRKFNKVKTASSLRRKKAGSSLQTIFFSIFLGILILAAIGFLVFSNLQINKRRTELTLRLESLKKEIEILVEKNQELTAKIPQVQKESYLEKEARERLNLKKPGEEMVVVLSPDKSEEEKPEEQKSFWQKFLEKLGF